MKGNEHENIGWQSRYAFYTLNEQPHAPSAAAAATQSREYTVHALIRIYIFLFSAEVRSEIENDNDKNNIERKSECWGWMAGGSDEEMVWKK